MLSRMVYLYRRYLSKKEAYRMIQGSANNNKPILSLPARGPKLVYYKQYGSL